MTRLAALMMMVLCLALQARADAPPRLHKVDLIADVTWAGKRGIQIPIKPGGEVLKGQCPPVLVVNTRFDPADRIAVEAHYKLSDGRTLDRSGELFTGGLQTEEWELPIHDDGQMLKGTVTIHISSPAIDLNDVTVPFAVQCASKAEQAAAACDTKGNSCHQGVQLASEVHTEISKELPPMSWSGGTIAPGTYVLTSIKQYSFEGINVTDDGKASRLTVVIKKSGAGMLAEMTATEGTCTQRSTLSVAGNPKPVEGMYAPTYLPVFTGAHAMTISASCPPPDAAFGLGAAFTVTPSGFVVMPITGTVMTFTRK